MPLKRQARPPRSTAPAGPAPPAASAVALPPELLPHWGRIVRVCQAQTEQAVGEMLQTAAALSAQLASLQEQGTPQGLPATPLAELAALVARLNEGLQYQDRQRQALELLQAEMDRASALSPTQADALDMNAWLAHFDVHCPLPELRRHSPVRPGADEGDAGLEYF